MASEEVFVSRLPHLHVRLGQGIAPLVGNFHRQIRGPVLPNAFIGAGENLFLLHRTPSGPVNRTQEHPGLALYSVA